LTFIKNGVSRVAPIDLWDKGRFFLFGEKRGPIDRGKEGMSFDGLKTFTTTSKTLCVVLCEETTNKRLCLWRETIAVVFIGGFIILDLIKEGLKVFGPKRRLLSEHEEDHDTETPKINTSIVATI